MTKKKVALDTTVLRRPTAPTFTLWEVENLLDAMNAKLEETRRKSRAYRPYVAIEMLVEDVLLAPHWDGSGFHARHRPGDQYAYLRLRIPVWVATLVWSVWRWRADTDGVRAREARQDKPRVTPP